MTKQQREKLEWERELLCREFDRRIAMGYDDDYDLEGMLEEIEELTDLLSED